LKVGHHGSSGGSTAPFLARVAPEIAIIQVGDNHPPYDYGHPKPDVLSRLWDVKANIYTTNVHGDIVITVTGKDYSISTEKSMSALTPTDPSIKYYIGNKNKNTLHSYDCTSLPSNSVYFHNLDEAMEYNTKYKLCPICKP